MKWLTHQELDELKAHGLHLLHDDPLMVGLFRKQTRVACSRQAKVPLGQDQGRECGRCLFCRARALRRANRKEGKP